MDSPSTVMYCVSIDRHTWKIIDKKIVGPGKLSEKEFFENTIKAITGMSVGEAAQEFFKYMDGKRQLRKNKAV